MYCKKCEKAIASCLDMAHIGLLSDSDDSPEEQAEMYAYDKGLLCASRGIDCEEETLEKEEESS